MTLNVKRPALVWALLLCILLVNGFMAAPSVGHAEHHAHHQAGTHSTGICAWLCAAGDNIESFVVPFTSHLWLIEHTVTVASQPVLNPSLVPYFLRGPPATRS
jgi:hypothetical protein